MEDTIKEKAPHVVAATNEAKELSTPQETMEPWEKQALMAECIEPLLEEVAEFIGFANYMKGQVA